MDHDLEWHMRAKAFLDMPAVARLSDEDAYETFKLIRWPETNGQPVCPRCGSIESYDLSTRRLFKCKACNYQFSVTSGTIFASRKLDLRECLMAIAALGDDDHTAAQLSRDLDCQYKTAHGLTRKLRDVPAQPTYTWGWRISREAHPPILPNVGDIIESLGWHSLCPLGQRYEVRRSTHWPSVLVIRVGRPDPACEVSLFREGSNDPLSGWLKVAPHLSQDSKEG